MPNPIINRKKLIRTESDVLFPFSQDFGLNTNLAGWTLSGIAQTIDGALVITPTLSAEILNDPGLEGTYTGGLCSALSKSGNPNLSQSADFHGGSKAQQVTATANLDRLQYPNVAVTLGTYYRCSIWAKRTAGSSGTAGYGGYLSGSRVTLPRVTSATYVQDITVFRAYGTGNIQLYVPIDYGSSGFDTIIFDDGSIKTVSLPTMSVYRKKSGTNYRVLVLPSTAQADVEYGGWVVVDNPYNPQNGIFVHHDARQTARMSKLLNGTWSVLISTTVAFNINSKIEGRRIGDTYQLYYGNIKQGTDQSVTDALIQNAEYVGVFSGDSTTKIKSFDLLSNP